MYINKTLLKSVNIFAVFKSINITFYNNVLISKHAVMTIDQSYFSKISYIYI